MAKIILAVLVMGLGALPASAQGARTGAQAVRAEAKRPSPKYWLSRDLSHLFGMMQVKA